MTYNEHYIFLLWPLYGIIIRNYFNMVVYLCFNIVEIASLKGYNSFKSKILIDIIISWR